MCDILETAGGAATFRLEAPEIWRLPSSSRPTRPRGSGMWKGLDYYPQDFAFCRVLPFTAARLALFCSRGGGYKLGSSSDLWSTRGGGAKTRLRHVPKSLEDLP